VTNPEGEREKLLNCPFCGSAAGKAFVPSSDPRTNGRGDLWIIGCQDAECATGFVSSNIDDSIKRWNARSDMQEQQK